jgi:hypothetical protein
MPTFDASLTARMADPGNPPNRWQGSLRCGWLDTMLLDYAISAMGCPLDGLALSCQDQSPPGGLWKIGIGYKGATSVLRLSQERDVQFQETLTIRLQASAPTWLEEVSELQLRQYLSEEAPIVIESWGPEATDRKLQEMPFRSMIEA